MAEQTVIFQSKVWYPTRPCQDVILCLTDAGALKTGDDVLPAGVAGSSFLLATLQNNGRFLGTGGMTFHPVFENPRDVELFQYELVYDDAQLADVLEPILCEDIVEIFPYTCVLTKLLALLA